MKKTLELGSSDVLDYIDGVEARIDHHAGNVRKCFRTLCDVVPQVASKLVAMESRSEKGLSETTNVLWATIRGRVYAFSYDHGSESIEIRKGSLRGAVLYSFNDGRTAPANIEYCIKAL